MSEQDAAVEAAPATPTPAKVVENAEPTEKMTVDAKVAEEAATKHEEKPKAGDEQAATPLKRRTSSPRVAKQPKETEGDDTESEPEKHPKKRAKTTKGAKRGPKPGRRKKAAIETEDDAVEEQREVEKKVAALSDDVKGRFGQIVWAKMAGYPFWPCIITDPRLLPKKLQETAMKHLETKFLVFFYVSNNYAPISFKMIESWDDTKNKYREGYPEKDSKAPKRRAKLMLAIEVADKETKLPIEDRADGLLKPVEMVAVQQPADMPTPVKRKPGRPPKAKTAPKATPTKNPKKRLTKDETEEVTDEKEATPATTQEEEEETTPPLSKEEIKAKVASRKTPKKKGADDVVNAAGASVKKAPKATTKHKLNGSDIDSKRKKEIELVVPHKTVKSADIREMTEEAAKKKLNGPKSKTKKDKGDYKVGDLASFASKMTRLHMKESSRNNDELVVMMQELFKETLMYRSDVERSGLAAIIALLRKSSNQTVGKTASALRKHMMNILNNDTEITHLGKKGHQDTAASGIKKRKAENGSAVKTEEQTKVSSPENSGGKEDSAAKDKAASSAVNALPTTKAEESKESKDAEVKEANKPVENVAAQPAVAEHEVVKTEGSAAAEVGAVKEERSAVPVKTEKTDDGAVKDTDMFEAPEHMDKNRTIFVNMLSEILDQDGAKRADLATEIEAALFERFKESSEDYLTQARIIIFGLKENAPMRKRLFSGALHCLEFAYADDAVSQVAAFMELIKVDDAHECFVDSFSRRRSDRRKLIRLLFEILPKTNSKSSNLFILFHFLS
ncbi:hypothetical protein L917_21421 [Phytophthora nicotianae]|uniref:PWWP domain-containing protein n=2 Tax=Phytophthora nicotianae TaxID=4792 RepID=W2JXM7_PHYNI|nr:hypothetical protein L915_21700 [Phytophthora nicotianae]ETL77637.1 hypothetical protein L917_21421 [Phytophthora nicotianae]ETO59327.1 hypothetical protein F444_22301 [Phytophthora nicotianae P1976]